MPLEKTLERNELTKRYILEESSFATSAEPLSCTLEAVYPTKRPLNPKMRLIEKVTDIALLGLQQLKPEL